MEALDLFSAAAGGWSLGLHRAGFRTIAACEIVPWRRALYAENNPGVRLYHDVQALTADQLVRDLGRLPGIIVGSPPCQDISTANTKGKGIEGARSKLFFEAIRLVGECRPRWFALENSANLRTRGADQVLGALEECGYSAWTFVVRACDVGANHERPRCWIVGCDAAQLDGDAGQIGLHPGRSPAEPSQAGLSAAGRVSDGSGCHSGGVPSASDASAFGRSWIVGSGSRRRQAESEHAGAAARRGPGADTHAYGERDSALHDEVEKRGGTSGDAGGAWSDWQGGLAHHLRLDDGLSARLARTSIVLGPRSRKSASNLLVEAFGDAVLPQIPEAIARAILRTEAAYALATGRAA